jgi:hypothetical protein
MKGKKSIEIKARYSVTLTQPATEKVQKVLEKANLSLSSFLDVMICNFSDLIDEQGISEKMDNLTMSGAFEILSNIFGKIEAEQEKEKELKKNVAEKESKKKMVP